MKKSIYILSCLIALFCSCQKDESVPVSSVTLDTSKITVKLGDFYQLSATVSPNNATNNAVVWMSTDAGIASVSGGLVSANGLGVAEITVKADDNGLSDHCMVTVVPEVIPLETIVLDRNEISLYEKESDTIKLSLFPVDTTEPDIFWTSSNDSVAVVNGGIVTALMAGQTTLRASSADGKIYAECAVSVLCRTDGVKLNYPEYTIEEGQTFTLKASVYPERATDAGVIWHSSDTKVADVDQSGKVSAFTAGYAEIVVITADGNYSDTCRLTVISPVNGISLDNDNLSMYVGDTYSLKASLNPANASNRTLKWSSTDESVAVVNAEGLVEALTAGKAGIVAVSEDGGFTSSCNVTVYNDVSGISLDSTSVWLYEGEFFDLVADVYPADAPDKRVTWESSDPDAVMVADGTIKVRKYTTQPVVIVAKTERGGYTASCEVHVKRHVSGVSLPDSVSTLTLWEGESFQLSAVVTPDDAYDKRVSWSVNDATVASVSSDGNVTALAKGKVRVTVSSEDGNKCAYCDITVKCPVRTIELSDTSLTLLLGAERNLTARVLPEKASDRTVEWISSDENVVSCNNGKLTAKGYGTATVTVRAKDGSGCSASCIVKIVKDPVTLTLNIDAYEMYEGDSVTLVASAVPNDDKLKIVWKSLDDKKVSVSDNGCVRALEAGTAEIVATVADRPEMEATCTVTVKCHVTGVVIDEKSVSMFRGSSLALGYKVYPERATDKSVSWSSSDEKVATVVEGSVQAHVPGKARITVTSIDGKKTGYCDIEVKDYIDSVVIVPSGRITIHEWDAPIALDYKIHPSGYDNQNVTWESESDDIVTVDSTGLMTPKAHGLANVRITTSGTDNDNKPVSNTVQVQVFQKVSGISITDGGNRELKVGDIMPMPTTSVTPLEDTDGTVIWSSSNGNVATVDSITGQIKATGSGMAVLKAVSKDNPEVSAECVITVYAIPDLVSISPEKKELYVNDTFTLSAKPSSRAGQCRQDVLWHSLNEKIATVSAEGLVKAVSAGTVQIEAVAVDNESVKAQCTVTVKCHATGIKLDKTALAMYPGGKDKLTATVSPSNAADKTVTWTSSNTAVATVDASGNVTAKTNGTATITATAKDGGWKASCTVTVKQGIAKVTITPSTPLDTMFVGAATTLTATITPSDYENRKVSWSSSNTAVATVDANGKVTPKGPGTVTITVTTDGTDNTGKQVTSSITANVYQHITAVSLNVTSKEVKIGESFTLTPTYDPSTGILKGVTWQSSDPSIATVDANGNVTAKAYGTAYIEVKTNEGQKTETCKVTVPAPAKMVTGITLNQSSIKLDFNKTMQLTATVTPSDAANKSIKWESDNTEIASVSSNGLVTGRTGGSTKIWARATDGSGVAAVCQVRVEKDAVLVKEISLSLSDVVMEKGKTQTLTATVTPTNADNRNLKWTSSNTAVATVTGSSTGATITSVAAGNAIITAAAEDGSGVSATCAVKVVDNIVSVTKIEPVGSKDISLYVGESCQLSVNVLPANATNKNVRWWVNGGATECSVSSTGLVTALNKGSARVFATSVEKENIEAMFQITVSNRPVESVSLDKSVITLKIGDKLKLSAEVLPSNATVKTINWSSSDFSVATVDSNGNVTAKGVGKMTVTATCKDGGKKAECKVRVIADDNPGAGESEGAGFENWN